MGLSSPTFSALFKMLGANRFDCIPLGIDEVEKVYQDKKAPELTKWLTLGLQKMQASGEFNQLFLKFHAEDMARLDLKKRVLICLKSPYKHEPQCIKPPNYPDSL